MKLAIASYLTFSLFEIVFGREKVRHAYCLLEPAVRGGCNEVQNLWTFYSEENECRLFPFNGCFGNSNQFQTLEICEDRCMSPKRKSITEKPASAVFL
ncbi:kunitz-type serine protease inhibitor HMGS1-like [Drosophila hydei]|uniref:Kunitz-type serine protease inhibitor HMGS1-like n=1 Tax=Drosophila hydei TaxID=7224 RepID=A0A6J1M1R5_DROHY|nr:kunitz-type serine protease inhibitor HMGS1-like [Drosophila hydei]